MVPTDTFARSLTSAIVIPVGPFSARRARVAARTRAKDSRLRCCWGSAIPFTCLTLPEPVAGEPADFAQSCHRPVGLDPLLIVRLQHLGQPAGRVGVVVVRLDGLEARTGIESAGGLERVVRVEHELRGIPEPCASLEIL